MAPKTSPYVNAQAQRLVAHIAARSGDWHGAAEAWHSARGIMLDARVPFDAAVLALELSQEAPNGNAGRDASRTEAIATFERLRARPWLDRARRGAARQMG